MHYNLSRIAATEILVLITSPKPFRSLLRFANLCTCTYAELLRNFLGIESRREGSKKHADSCHVTNAPARDPRHI